MAQVRSQIDIMTALGVTYKSAHAAADAKRKEAAATGVKQDAPIVIKVEKDVDLVFSFYSENHNMLPADVKLLNPLTQAEIQGSGEIDKAILKP